MSESISHKRAKSKAAGKSGQTEKKLKSGQRIDAKTPKKATKVERSGTKSGLEKAAERLKQAKTPQKVLQVPNNDIPKAVEAMKNVGVKGTVKNMTGSKRRSVKA